MNQVKKNFIYNITYQILILIIPLITIPYVSRIIGANGIGIYSYTYSIVYYFIIFAMLGFNNYGNRTIAKVRDDKEKLSKTFKEIYFFQLIMSFTMLIFYILYLFLFDTKYWIISLIQCLYLISCMFDINWFFFGLEQFKITITRNILIKIFSLVLIFTLVKHPTDIWVYTLILSGSSLLSNLLIWPFVPKYVSKVKINFIDIKKHFIPCLKLFLPVIAVTVYKVMDKTMIGLMANVSEVGYYENAEKIINVPIAIITALGTIMMPRMSNLYSKNEDELSKAIIKKSIKLMMFLAFAMTFGLIAISKDFSLLFFGNDFEKTGILIIFLAITIIFLSWGNVIRTQYLIPKEYDKIYIISAFLGAVVNFIINLLLIPKYSSIGACIGTIFAELVVMLYQTICIRKELPLKEYIVEIIPFFITSLIMFFSITMFNFIKVNSLVRILIQIMAGVIIYFGLNYRYILSFVDLKKLSRRETI